MKFLEWVQKFFYHQKFKENAKGINNILVLEFLKPKFFFHALMVGLKTSDDESKTKTELPLNGQIWRVDNLRYPNLIATTELVMPSDLSWWKKNRSIRIRRNTRLEEMRFI